MDVAYITLITPASENIRGTSALPYHLIYKTAPHLLYNVLQILNLLFSFLIGASLNKWSIPEKIKALIEHNVWIKIIPISTIILLLFIGAQIKTTAFGPFTATLMFLSLLILMKGYEVRWLQILGKHSMNMWMVHTFFLYYLFHDTIYSLTYTILVIAATLFLSMICSVIINRMTLKLDRLIYDRKF